MCDEGDVVKQNEMKWNEMKKRRKALKNVIDLEM